MSPSRRHALTECVERWSWTWCAIPSLSGRQRIIEEYRLVSARPKHKPYHPTMLAITDLMEEVASIVEPAEHSWGNAPSKLSDPLVE
jgi:hypothetical protein